MSSTARAEPGAREAGAPGIPAARNVLRALRPKQWAKNVLVVAAPGAAGVLSHGDVLGKVALAFVSFCLVSSATYLLNDVRDLESDRRHPTKRHRPIAAGELGVPFAIALEEPVGRYRKLVLRDDRVIGAILLGYSREVAPA